MAIIVTIFIEKSAVQTNATKTFAVETDYKGGSRRGEGGGGRGMYNLLQVAVRLLVVPRLRK
jgi:hypothetical protein